jgi:hypothetical protein
MASKFLKIRVEPAEFQRIEAAARRANLSISNLIRSKLDLNLKPLGRGGKREGAGRKHNEIREKDYEQYRKERGLDDAVGDID